MTFRHLLLASGLTLLCSCVTTLPGGDETEGPRSRPNRNAHASVDVLNSRSKDTDGATAYREVSDSPSEERQYQQARMQYNAGQKHEALVLMEGYLKRNPVGQYADDAGLLLGKAAYESSEFERAEKFFRGVSAFNPPSRYRGEALYNQAMAQSANGQRKAALQTLAKLDSREIPPQIKKLVFSFWAQIASEEGRYLESTLANIKAYREVSDSREQSVIESAIDAQIQDRLSEGELQLILREYPSQYPAPVVQLRLITLKLASGKRTEAKELLQQIIANTPPSSRYHQKAQAMISRMGSLDEISEARIGALLPLSGDQEAAGRSIADGLELGISEGKSSIQIVTADSGPSIDSALAAFDRLVFEEKVSVVVGPLSGNQVERVATKAAELGIPYISLSPRPGIIEKGPSIFRVALSPERQVRAIVGYAWDRLNARNFAVLFPEDNFGKEYALEFFKVVAEKGGVVTAAESYDPRQSDFKIQIDNMVGTSFPAFRKTEAEALLKQLDEKLGRKPTKRELATAKIPPIVDFDLLFIPDTYKTVGQIAPALLYADVSTAQLAGPSTWHNSRLLERAGNYLDKSIFVDVFALERQSPVTKAFIDKYQIKKGSLPNPLSAIGYDVGLTLRTAFGNGGNPRSRDELRSRLETLGSLEGVLGLHVWDSNRDSLSEIQLFQIHKGAFHHQGGILLKARND